MRILHLVESIDPGTGGPQAVICRLSAAQSAVMGDSSTVRVVSLAIPGREAEFAASIKDIPGIERVEFITLSPGSCPGALLPRATISALQESITQTEVLHLHGVWDRFLWCASVEARRANVPYVVTPHGMLDPWSLQQGALKKKMAMAMCFRRMLKRAACLHLLNSDEARLIVPLRLGTPTRVIPNGVFLEEIEPLPRPGTFRAAHPELKNDPYILFLGRLHYKKGLDILAESFGIVAKRQAGVRLVVAGPDEGARNEFEQRVRSAGLSDRVHVIGPIYGRDKFAAIVDAACFCLPSRQEGFSMAILEAIACGTPVVISEQCHFPEIAASGAGVIMPLDAISVANGLERVSTNASGRATMGNAGRALVRERFTWPTIAQQMLAMYKGVVSGL